VKKEPSPYQTYVCNGCGYEYDPAVGDPENGILPGTPWEALPEEWVCPYCAEGKEEFVKVEKEA
jgi:butyryl-CoA dehydrogenase